MTMIPARYKGTYEKQLSEASGPYLDGNGKPLQSLFLHPGDVIMMDETEVNGFTEWRDPRAEQDPQYLGPGIVIPAEHKGKSLAQLQILGYVFHEGRRDFEPHLALVPQPAKKDGEK